MNMIQILRSSSTRVLLALALSLSASGMAVGQNEEMIQIDLDFARILRLAVPAGTIVLGNPEIADAAVRDERTLVLTGKSAGLTNLLVLNEDGEEVSNLLLRVGVRAGQHVTVRAGRAWQTYLCNPGCGAGLSAAAAAETIEQ